MSHNFYICSSLISTILDYPVNSNPVSSNTKVSNKAFATKLSNPCTLIDESSLESVDSRHIPLRTTMSQMIADLSRANETAEAFLKAGDLRKFLCTASVFPPDENIPLVQNVLNNFTVEVARMFYTSLVNHTTYVFFIFEQIEKCTGLVDIDSNEAGKLASQMKAAMCSFRQLAIAVPGGANDSMKDAHKQIFNEELIDFPRCSKLMAGTCQTLQSVLKLLRELLCYLDRMKSSQLFL